MMKALFLLTFLLFSTLFGSDEAKALISNGLDKSSKQYNRLVNKGKRVAHKLCDEKKLLQITALDENAIKKEIESIKPCTALNRRNQKALIYFLLSEKSDSNITNRTIKVPKDGKCPVCGMFVKKYPKWVATIKIKGKINYFDGVKDMMKFYIFDADFPYNREKIESIEVTDFYTLKAINAKDAFYVLGSNIFGPMGDELIPFKDKESAQNFLQEHSGEEIVEFKDISSKLVMGLDGIEL